MAAWQILFAGSSRACLRRRGRRCDQWRIVSGLCRAGSGADAEAGRCRHHGQSEGPQNGRGSPSDRGGRGEAAVHPELQPRLEPNRDGSLQAHVTPASKGDPDCRGALEGAGRPMRKLHRGSAPTTSATMAISSQRENALVRTRGERASAPPLPAIRHRGHGVAAPPGRG